MPDLISTQGVHHITLTVSEIARSEKFYTELFNFQKVGESNSRPLLHNGTVLLVLTLPSDPSQAISDDRFNENRIGLDHLSLSVASMADLESAVKILDVHGIEHGGITSLERGGIAILAMRDPDNIQIELTAPLT